jgi:pilus assembly protein CpaE
LQNDASTENAATRKGVRGFVYTRDDALGKAIADEVRPICRIETVTGSAPDLLAALEGGERQALFVHVPDAPTDETDAGFSLVRQVRRTRPDTGVFIIADRKDPDLILTGLRLGVRDVILPSANSDGRFLPSLRRFMGHGPDEGRNGFVYGVFSLKGGQGTTTLSVNLADQIQTLTPGRVLLLDLNLYMGDVGSFISIAPDFTPFDLIRDLSRMDENLLFSSITRHPRGFYVLPAPAEISDAERVHRDQIRDMLALLKEHFFHIVVDLPHDFSERTLATVDAADRVVVLVVQNLVSLKSARQILAFFHELNYGEERISVVLNRLDRSDVLKPEDVRMILKHPLYESIADDRATLTRSLRKGEPLAAAFPRRRITRDVRRLAERLTGMPGDGARRGWFRWPGRTRLS